MALAPRPDNPYTSGVALAPPHPDKPYTSGAALAPHPNNPFTCGAAIINIIFVHNVCRVQTGQRTEDFIILR